MLLGVQNHNIHPVQVLTSSAPQIPAPPLPTFQVVPDKLVIEPHCSEEVTISGFSATPGQAKQRLLCQVYLDCNSVSILELTVCP